jgi:SagB-type dehydrogenase family enzyme
MHKDIWIEAREPESAEDRLWELFHENSKVTAFESSPRNDEVARMMTEQYDRFSYDAAPRLRLSSPRDLAAPLGLMIRSRRTPRTLTPRTITLEDLATLLFHTAGITCPEKENLFIRPLRAAPSAGAMYPIDAFVHVTQAEGLSNGMYHYNPYTHELLHLFGDRSRAIADALVQAQLAYDSTLIIFLVATFERTTQKYGERGFRFTLIEAGHIAQNILLVATCLGLAGVPLGGYYDRQIDSILGFDGVTHSTIYGVALGSAG